MFSILWTTVLKALFNYHPLSSTAQHPCGFNLLCQSSKINRVGPSTPPIIPLWTVCPICHPGEEINLPTVPTVLWGMYMLLGFRSAGFSVKTAFCKTLTLLDPFTSTMHTHLQGFYLIHHSCLVKVPTMLLTQRPGEDCTTTELFVLITPQVNSAHLWVSRPT